MLVVSEREHIDRTAPEGRLQTGILGEFAEFEKEKIRARTRSALAARARSGLATGGYGYARQDKQLVPVRVEADVIARIFDDWINGVTQRAIARALNAGGVAPARSGHWTQGMVSRVLANPLYKGWFRFNGDVLQGTHEPIVTEAVWDLGAARPRDERAPERRPLAARRAPARQGHFALRPVRLRDDPPQGPAWRRP